MEIYLQQMDEVPSQRAATEVDKQWKLLGGHEKGFISLSDFNEAFGQTMPKCFDRDLALELFRELDSDRDGKITFKDFNDCMKF